MIYCPKCGKELKDGTAFCSNCGTKLPTNEPVEPVVKQEPAVQEVQQAEPVVAQEVAAEVPAEVPAEEAPAEVPAEEAPAEETATERKFPKKLIGIIGGAVAAVIVLLVAILLIAGSGSKKSPALFLKEKEIFSTYLSKIEPMQVTDKLVDTEEKIGNKELAQNAYMFGYRTYLANDGKTLFYPDKIDDGMSLYYRDLQKSKQEPIKLDSDVSQYTVSADGKRVVYLKTDGSLYRHNLKDKEKIASEVEGFVASEDCKQIIFMTEEGDLYAQKLGKDKEKLATEISDVEYINEDCTVVYYISDEALYKVELGKDKVKVLSEVNEVLMITDEGKIYYTKSGTEEVTLSSYVEDDMKAQDATMEKPQYPTKPSYPYYSQYNNMEEYNIALDEYNLAMDEYYAAQDAYNEQYSKYQQKLNRDELREELDEMKITIYTADVFYFDGKDSKSVCEDVRCDEYGLDSRKASDADVLVFSGYGNGTANKVKLSEIDSIYTVENNVNAAMKESTVVYVAIDGTATKLDFEDKAMDAYDIRISADGKLMYYLDNISEENGHGDLYQIEISGGKAKKAELYDSDVYSGSFGADGSFYYFKDVKDRIGELFVDKTRVDYDVYTGNVTSTEDGTYYFMTEYKDNSGTLKIYNGKKAVKVAEEVYNYDVLADGTLLYLNDYSTEKYYGTLYTYTGKKSVKIADDVVAILSYQQAK